MAKKKEMMTADEMRDAVPEMADQPGDAKRRRNSRSRYRIEARRHDNTIAVLSTLNTLEDAQRTVEMLKVYFSNGEYAAFRQVREIHYVESAW